MLSGVSGMLLEFRFFFVCLFFLQHVLTFLSLILFHQFIPFFILCLDIIGNPDHLHLEEDLVSIGWISDFVELVIKERVELKPVMIIIKSMATACQQTKMDRLSCSTDATHI